MELSQIMENLRDTENWVPCNEVYMYRYNVALTLRETSTWEYTNHGQIEESADPSIQATSFAVFYNSNETPIHGLVLFLDGCRQVSPFICEHAAGGFATDTYTFRFDASVAEIIGKYGTVTLRNKLDSNGKLLDQ